jgi:hypothetical protein
MLFTSSGALRSKLIICPDLFRYAVDACQSNRSDYQYSLHSDASPRNDARRRQDARLRTSRRLQKVRQVLDGRASCAKSVVSDF